MTTTNGQLMNYLDSSQHDLLTAALNSNTSPQNGTPTTNSMQQFGNDGTQLNHFSFDGMDPAMFMNQNSLAMTNFDGNLGAIDDSPFLDNYDDADFNYEFDEQGQMIGNFPGEGDGENDNSQDDDDGENGLHDKRKSPDDEKEDNENGGKRREGESKEAKKPGRKPLTSEPTNKRKAQNRAAQRAFRERKEKHLKDLETKVQELEKASESSSHENGLLKAQVDRLQIELREYRKRLSLNSGLGRSPALGNNMFLPTATNGANNFQFDFPRFGSLPGGGVFGKNGNNKIATPPATNGSTSSTSTNTGPGVLARNQSNIRSVSPTSQMRSNGSISSGPSPAHMGSVSSTTGTPEQSGNNADSMSSVFTPASMNGFGGGNAMDFNNWVTTTTSAEPESTVKGAANPARVFQFNSNSVSSASPGSSSSASQYGANSSCGTSPEPSHNSPQSGHLDTITECKTIQTYNEDGGEAGEVSFCDRLNMACGNIRNPVPRTKSRSNGSVLPGANDANNASLNNTITNTNSNANANINPFAGFDELASQNGGAFDPVLFDTYREPQAAIVGIGGDGDFTGGFFNDAMPTMDFSSPFGWADLTAPTGLTPGVGMKSNPLEVADRLVNGEVEGELEGDDGEGEVVPGDEPGALLSCHKIWDKLQTRDDFKDGSLDIDGLCSELRAKARCSETGVVIDQKDVDSALEQVQKQGMGGKEMDQFNTNARGGSSTSN